MADHIGHLAVDVSKQELDREQTATLEPNVQRRLSWWLRKALAALSGESGRGGLVAAADPAQKKVVEAVAQEAQTTFRRRRSNRIQIWLAPLKDLESVLQPRGMEPPNPPRDTNRAPVRNPAAT